MRLLPEKQAKMEDTGQTNPRDLLVPKKLQKNN
jgi:hypothetical protein